jgi:hypothetical protein
MNERGTITAFHLLTSNSTAQQPTSKLTEVSSDAMEQHTLDHSSIRATGAW